MSSRLLYKGTVLLGLPILLAALTLSGCNVVSSASAAYQQPPAGMSGNWQIQTGSAITPGPKGAVFLAGAVEMQGSQATATLATDAICGVQPVANYTGTFNDTTGVLTLTNTQPPAAVTVSLAVPPDTTTLSVGTIGASGILCALAMAPTASVGVQIPPLTGTYTGTIQDTAPTPAPGVKPGTATLTLTQSTTPNTNAQFPLTGTFQFTSSDCSASVPVAGTISGVAFTLASTGSTAVTISGADASGGTALTINDVYFPNGPCPGFAMYSGTLNLQ